jgi:hypothetical protein
MPRRVEHRCFRHFALSLLRRACALGVARGRSSALVRARVEAAQKQLLRARAQTDTSTTKQTKGTRHG